MKLISFARKTCDRLHGGRSWVQDRCPYGKVCGQLRLRALLPWVLKRCRECSMYMNRATCCMCCATNTNQQVLWGEKARKSAAFFWSSKLGFRKEWSQHLCKRFLSSLITSTENHRLASVSLATQSRCLFYFSVAINLDKNLVPIRCGALDRFNGFVKQLNLAKWRLSPNTIYFDNFYEFVRQLNCNWAKWRFSPKLYI